MPISSLVVRDKELTPAEVKEGKKNEEEGIYLIDGAGRAKFAAIQKGIIGELEIEIVSGLKEGQDIITGPYDALRQLKDGLLVKPETKTEVKK